MKKSLHELLKQADELIASAQTGSIRKEANQADMKVSAFTDFLLNADTFYSDDHFPAVEADPEFEKIAVHVNLIHAVTEVAHEIKLGEFEKRAAFAGYSEKEIADVIGQADAAELLKAVTEITNHPSVKLDL